MTEKFTASNGMQGMPTHDGTMMVFQHGSQADGDYRALMVDESWLPVVEACHEYLNWTNSKHAELAKVLRETFLSNVDDASDTYAWGQVARAAIAHLEAKP